MTQKEPSLGWAIVGVLAAPFVVLYGIFKVITEALNIFKNSERELERKSKERTLELYEEACKTATYISDKDFILSVFKKLSNVPDYLFEPLVDVVVDVYVQMDLQEVPPPPAVCHSIEGARYRDLLAEYGARTPHNLDRSADLLAACLQLFIDRMPENNDGELNVTIDDTWNKVAYMTRPLFLDEYEGHLPFLQRQYLRNMREVGCSITEYRGDDAPQDYLKHTPFLQLFDIRVPFAIPDKAYFEHAHIVGGTGAGKTQLITYLILHHLRSPDRPSLVIVDSQGDLLDHHVREAAVG